MPGYAPQTQGIFLLSGPTAAPRVCCLTITGLAVLHALAHAVQIDSNLQRAMGELLK